MKISNNDNNYLMYKLNNVKLQQFYLKCQKDKLIGIDTEFYRVNTYYPKLCLIQISNLKESIILDPISHGLDKVFLEKLLYDKSIRKIFFAANQDLEIIFKIFGRLPQPVCDLQICISIINDNPSTSYSTACKIFLAIYICKNNQFIDWRKRPLDYDKINYALNDVKYLIPLYLKLNQKYKINENNILLKKMHQKILNPNNYSEKHFTAWKKLRFVPKSQKELQDFKKICEIREKSAINKDIPVKKVITNNEIKLFFKKNSSFKSKKKIINKTKNIKIKEILESYL